MVSRHEEFGVAEGLHGPNADDDLLSGSFSGIDLPVELVRSKSTRLGFHPIPVGAEPDQLKRVGEQGAQRLVRVQAERLDLRGAKADADLRQAARLDRHRLPFLGLWTVGPSDPDLGDQR
jgi:hypothetical protein